MVSIEQETSDVPESCDTLRRIVHLTLAIYLAPVLLVVCLIGATSIVAQKGFQLFGAARRRSSRPAIERPNLADGTRIDLPKPHGPRVREQSRTRVSR